MNPILLLLFLSRKYLESYFEKEVKMNFTKQVKADSDSPRQEVSNDDLGNVVALSVFGIFCVCVHWGSNPAVVVSDYCAFWVI